MPQPPLIAECITSVALKLVLKLWKIWPSVASHVVITLTLEHIKHPWQRCWAWTAFIQQTRLMMLPYTCTCTHSLSLCLGFRALETDWLLLLLLTDPATLSLQQLAGHRRSNVTSLVWLQEDAWNSRGFFICYPTTNNKSLQPFLSQRMCFSLTLWSFLMFVHPFERQLIVSCLCALPVFFTYCFCDSYISGIHTFVCWCIDHSPSQWKLNLCQTGVTWIT